MHILFWAPYVNPGGGARLMAQLVRGMCLHPAVRRVRLAVPTNYVSPPLLDGLERLERFDLGTLDHPKRNWRLLGLPATGRAHLRFRRLFGLPTTIGEQLALRFPQAAEGCDVGFSFWPHDHTGMGGLPEGALPWVATFQDLIVLDYPSIFGAETFYRERTNLASCLGQAARVVVSSRATAQAIARHFPEWRQTPTLIHHAISPAPSSASADLPRPAGVPSRYIVSATNIAPHKNLDSLLAAWSRWEAAADWPLVVFGYGTDALNRKLTDDALGQLNWRPLDLVAQVIRRGLVPGRQFHALGYVPDGQADALVAGASALIMPSLAEGGGSFPVEEALNAGVPVLCSDIPVMREHLAYRSARIGWFDAESVSDILRCLREFVAAEPEFRASAQRGAQDARPTWNEVAAQYVTVFEQVCGGSR